jgi:hypothetical protein
MMVHSYGHIALRFIQEMTTHSGQHPVPAPATETAESNPAHGLPFERPDRSLYSKPKSFSPDLAALLRYEKVGIPLGASEDIRRFLKSTGRFVPEYWPWVSSYLGTEADIDRKLRDLERMNVILVPREVFLVDNFMTIAVAPDLRSPAHVDPIIHRANAEHILTPLTFFPVRLPMARNTPVLPEVRILADIAKNYSARGEFRDFIIAVKD